MKNFNEKWINVLTENGRINKQQEFNKILENSKCEMLAIMKYRRLEKQNGRGSHITLEQLQRYNICSEEVVIEILQELFLENIEMDHIEYFYKTASKKYDNMINALEELYKRHMECPGTRFLSIANTI